MSRIPQPFWAVLLALLGAALALAALYRPSPENIALAVLGVGSNLVSGALGAFAGHALAEKTNVTTGDASVSIDPK
jgi:hypothetical protein